MEKHIIKDLNLTNDEKISLFGAGEQNLKIIETYYDVNIIARGEEITIYPCTNEVKEEIHQLLRVLLNILKTGYPLYQKDIIQIITLAKNNQLDKFSQLQECLVGKTFDGMKIHPKTIGQLAYINDLSNYDIVFCIGPAGTGKTYLAVIRAVWMLKNKIVDKIILTRPAVEAGENLGFLPGDLKEKVDPYLRPLYDSLDEALGKENTEKLIERGVIEIAPLAYMRGRTLENAYIILDEAQNTTLTQMKMFLTRLGFQSKMVITGDITQIDLRNHVKSGLETIEDTLGQIKEIKFCRLSSSDVVRHPLVQKIIDAYENNT